MASVAVLQGVGAAPAPVLFALSMVVVAVVGLVGTAVWWFLVGVESGTEF